LAVGVFTRNGEQIRCAAGRAAEGYVALRDRGAIAPVDDGRVMIADEPARIIAGVGFGAAGVAKGGHGLAAEQQALNCGEIDGGTTDRWVANADLERLGIRKEGIV